MKLDKIRFAMLVNWLSRNGLHKLAPGDFEDLDNLIDVEVPVADPYCAPAAHDINYLMALMAAGTQKIEAIKIHRKLTRWGLKESKDAVEAYWLRQPAPDKLGPKGMLDCIDTNIQNVGTASANPHFLLNDLSKSDIVVVRNFIESFAN